MRSRWPLSPRAVQWHAIPAEKLSTAQGGPLSPRAVQWHIIAAEKLSTAQGGPLSPRAVQWHGVAAEKLSTAQGGPLSPRAVQWHVTLAVELCTLPTAAPGLLHFLKSAVLYPSLTTLTSFRSLRSTTLSLSSSVPCQPLLPGTFRRATLSHSSFRIHDGPTQTQGCS